MTQQQPQCPSRRNRFLAIALAITTVVPAIRAAAQNKAVAPQRAAGAAAPSAAKSALDSLDDNKVMAELANRGLNDLLEYYFQKNNVTDEKRKETKVLIALQHLDSPEFSRKSAVERKKEIDDILAGINGILPT